MGPLIIAVATAVAMGAVYELTKATKKVPNTPVTPPAPIPNGGGGAPINPNGLGVTPTPPPVFPGFAGISNEAGDSLATSQAVSGIWANSAIGARAKTGDATTDDATEAQQAIVHGIVQDGSTPDAVIVQITDVSNPNGGFTTPANLTAGNTVTTPATVWIPVVATTAGSTAIVVTADSGSAGALNVRKSASTKSAIVGTIPHGAVVAITSPPLNGWAGVSFQGITGFASTEFLQGT